VKVRTEKEGCQPTGCPQKGKEEENSLARQNATFSS
jgi:hypothetical protein